MTGAAEMTAVGPHWTKGWAPAGRGSESGRVWVDVDAAGGAVGRGAGAGARVREGRLYARSGGRFGHISQLLVAGRLGAAMRHAPRIGRR